MSFDPPSRVSSLSDEQKGVIDALRTGGMDIQVICNTVSPDGSLNDDIKAYAASKLSLTDQQKQVIDTLLAASMPMQTICLTISPDGSLRQAIEAYAAKKPQLSDEQKSVIDTLVAASMPLETICSTISPDGSLRQAIEAYAAEKPALSDEQKDVIKKLVAANMSVQTICNTISPNGSLRQAIEAYAAENKIAVDALATHKDVEAKPSPSKKAKTPQEASSSCVPPPPEPLNVSRELTKDEQDNILDLMNSDFPVDKIIKLVGATPGGGKAERITTFVNSLMRPPRAPPAKCKSLVVKTSGHKLPVYKYSSEKVPFEKYYTFLVLGETGTGKTTLLDAFVNCLDDVQYTDNWRWKLVDENKMKEKHGSASQTTEITYYYITDKRPGQKKCNVKIIDSPGFGDTGGISADEKTVQKFEQLFRKEIQELDFILLVVKAGETRWTPAARYIYDRIQQIFGRDAKDRFILMCTFADGAIPVAVETLKPHVVFEKYFPFNNSALYTPSQKGTNQTKFFWKMCISSVNDFLDFVVKKSVRPLSLTLSVQVLDERRYLETTIRAAQDRIQGGFATLESTVKLIELIKKNEKQINENGSFTYDHEEKYIERQPLSSTYQSCAKCNVTCCQSCEWPAGATESQCSYFNGGRPCPCCPGNCPKSDHVRATDLIVWRTRTVKKEFVHKKQAFQEGQQGLSAAQRLLEEKHREMDTLAQKILEDMQDVKTCLQRLDQIAMKPRVFTNAEYFEQMIKHEEEVKNPGWESRVQGLKLMLDRAKNIERISQASNLTDLFSQYKNVINEAMQRVQGAKTTGDANTACALM
mmetsp:Transcript_123545/g.238234  ORF Transcript_123545/g.238234 Transcript_123545/m.238234 type:complete len:814 (+) Transcript_123545:116-2557(+)